MMITLMLVLALIAIGLLTVLPEIGQQIRRDREEELRNRGTAYMRAIQHFYKKFNRYPSRIEELENTNNLRYLRRRYTDPMSIDRETGKEKDFKFLRQQDITLNNGPVLGQTPGGPPNGPGALGAQPNAQQPAGAGTQTPASGDSGNSSSGSPSSGNSTDAQGNSNSPGSSSSSNAGSGSGFNGPTFGGGPILGVASTNKKDKTIRVFFDKNHYSDWWFIYVPQAAAVGLLTGPVNPNYPTGNLGGLTPGQLPGGAPGPGGFGQGLGQGLTPNSGQNQVTPTPPPPTPAPTP